jgi:acyl dehydratase
MSGQAQETQIGPRIAEGVLVGQQLPKISVRLTRGDLVRYAGASTDFNPIHWSDAAAEKLGLPGVVAHGMLTMGMALRVVTDWIGDPARIRAYSVRFAKPVVVDPEHGATVELSGEVVAVSAGVATVSLTALSEGQKVLVQAKAEVRLD